MGHSHLSGNIKTAKINTANVKTAWGLGRWGLMPAACPGRSR
ncbi:hypothetical protein [Prochlorothrix hollandica]|nr:hypothetical protein [Prochlorothrix hollandica]